MGYTKRGNNGYIRQIDEKFRFHLFITVDRKSIYLHSDETIGGKHFSSSDGVTDEKCRIKSEIIKRRPGYVHEDGLTHEQILEALKRLKEENAKNNNVRYK